MTGREPPSVRLVSAGTGTATHNPGMALELDWIEDVRVNRSAVERRAATEVKNIWVPYGE